MAASTPGRGRVDDGSVEAVLNPDCSNKSLITFSKSCVRVCTMAIMVVIISATYNALIATRLYNYS